MGTTYTDEAGNTVTGYQVYTSTAQAKYGNASLAFNGLGSYDQIKHLKVPTSADFEFPADFTLEFWAYCLGHGSSWGTFWIEGRAGTTSRSIVLYSAPTTGQIGVHLNNVEVIAPDANTALSTGAWVHVAFSREGDTCRLFINGSVAKTGTYSGTVLSPSDELRVGCSFNSANTTGLSGYVDDLRIVKNAAIYTDAFTPPTAELTTLLDPVAPETDEHLKYVQMHLHFDGEYNSNVWTCERGTRMQAGGLGPDTAQKKFGNASMRSNGVSQGHLVGSTKYIGTGDFTIEFWIHPITGGHGSNWARMIAIGPNSTNGALYIVSQLATNPMVISVDSHSGGYNRLIDSSVTVPNDTWSHIVLQRASGTYTLFIDGVSRGTSTSTVGNDITQRDVHFLMNSVNGEIFYGYIDEFRLTAGVARYSGDFTPPVAPYPSW